MSDSWQFLDQTGLQREGQSDQKQVLVVRAWGPQGHAVQTCMAGPRTSESLLCGTQAFEVLSTHSGVDAGAFFMMLLLCPCLTQEPHPSPLPCDVSVNPLRQLQSPLTSTGTQESPWL